MEKKAIIEKINKAVKSSGLPKKITLTESNTKSSFKELGLDSLEAFPVIEAVEKEFNIMFDDDTLINIKTLNDLINAIEKLI